MTNPSFNDTLSEAELTSLESSANSAEYNQRVRAVKAAHGGRYPLDWFPKVLASGLFSRLEKKWGQPGAMSIKLKAGERTIGEIPASAAEKKP